MKLYCVYGLVDWEGEHQHNYFLCKCDAEEFKILWEDDMKYMDSIGLTEITAIGDYGQSIPKSELRRIVNETNL